RMDQRSERMPPTSRPENWEEESKARSGNLTFDTMKERIANQLQRVARTLQEQVGPRGEGHRPLAGYGAQAAEWLERSAEYVRQLDPQQLKADLENQVRHSPGRSLLIAGAAGLLLGALLRRR
ncbi:MAG: hypothetical protein L0177_20610, partial [Chloroflexi bacterium]|nr:hypothetical protein [Chloroflexota bacterium]